MLLLGSDRELKGILLYICVLLNRGFLHNSRRLLSPSVDHQHRVFRVLLVLHVVPVAVVEQVEPEEKKTQNQHNFHLNYQTCSRRSSSS